MAVFDNSQKNNSFNRYENAKENGLKSQEKEKTGKGIQNRILFPQYDLRRSDFLQRERNSVSGYGDRINPFENRLPRLTSGEFSYVERVFTEKGHFGYVAPEQINSLEDVAYIFNKLEDEAVENSFVVYVKNKQPIVQHLGIGNFASVPVNVPAMFEGARRIKPDQIYFVHNHPSGNLTPSDADRRMYRMLKAVLKDKLMDAIIINLRSGKYSTFNLEENHIAYKNSGREGKPVRVFAFDRQVFDKDFNPETAFQLTSSEDVAAFISSHRLGERDKLSFLVLNRSMKITGNFFVPQTMLTMNNVAEVAEYIAARVITHGGESVITYGSALQEQDAAKTLKRLLTLEEINFLDAVTIKGEQVISYADEGILAESGTEYSPGPDASESNGVRFRRLSQAGFFSTVEDAIEKISQSRGTAIQFKAMLMRYGAKQAELDFMGWSEQFPEPLQKISKPDIQKWIDRNRIEVSDIQKERITPELTPEEWRRYHDLEDRIAEAGDKSLSEEELREYEQLDNRVDLEYDNSTSHTRYEQYTLPGGRNYKEMLLSMPQRISFDNYSVRQNPDNGKWYLWNETEKEAFAPLNEIIEYDNKEEAEERAWQRSRIPIGSDDYFETPHWDEENILAHVRFNERTDNDGNKVLFIEELQSDWQSEGRKRGFEGAGVPDMPFRQTDQWLSLAFRRMMRYAVENNFDHIAWTPGNVQSDRYRLNQQVDAIEVSYRAEGRYHIHPLKNGEKLKPLTIRESDLPEYVGKELASKIISKKTSDENVKRYSGLDLNIGGEGLKAFYDRIVPSVIGKLVKPVGGRVTSVQITIPAVRSNSETASQEEAGRENRTNENLIVSSVAITEKMRNMVTAGLPLFRTVGDSKSFSATNDHLNSERIRDYFETLNSMTKNADKVHVTESIDDLPKAYREMARQQNIYGFYNPASGETWLLTKNIHSTDEALKTWIHEVGMHHGLSNIIPSHMLNPFFEKIVDDLGLYEIRKVLPKNYLDLPKAEIGEEYLAFLGERIIQQRDLTLKDRIIWAKIIEQFKDLLNKVFNPQAKFTKLDAEKIVKAAIASVYQERYKVRGYNDAYQPFGTSNFQTDALTAKVHSNNDLTGKKGHMSVNSWIEQDSGKETHRPFKR
ncbi:MAG: JAB domain-containing protein [Prolixibacteraceae bacterium]